MTYSPSDAQAVKDYFADRLSMMLAEAERCGVSNTAPIKHKAAMAQDWALSNHLTVAQVRFSELQYWLQAEELETTADQEVLTFAVEFLPNQIHQQAIAKNPNATAEILEQVIKQGTVSTMAVVASNPNATDAMLTELLETANKTLRCLSRGLRNAWPEKTATDRKADGADELRKAVLSALESRKANPVAE
jgi:hypothetical protein